MISFALRTTVLVVALTLAPETVVAAGFSEMAQPEEARESCVAPKPPREIGPTAYIRNSYRAVLRIIAAERAVALATCDCLFADISWDEVVATAESRFLRTDNPLLPYDVSGLWNQADALEAERLVACGG